MTTQANINAILMGLPGKRGIDIPADDYDQLHTAAMGEAMPVWGRPPTPEQMQHLYDNKLTQPAQVKQFYGSLQHPHVPGITVAEYPRWEQALQAYKGAGGK